MPPLSLPPDEADEAAPAPPGQRGAAAAQGALPEAHLADAGAGQPQADGGGHHGVRGEHDAARPAGHVQQDGQPGRSPGLAKSRPDETRAGHSARAGEVSRELTHFLLLIIKESADSLPPLSSVSERTLLWRPSLNPTNSLPL